jgi:3-hydroxyisobutyrate dehydrogenase
MSSTAARTSVSLVGLGALGTPIAARLGAAGLDLAVYDIDAAKVRDLAATTGARAAYRPEDLSSADFYVCLLPDSNVVESVMLGDRGLFEVAKAGALIIDMGSSDPRRTRRLAGHASARGIHFVDAPVSGGLARARTGTLTVIFGGPQDLLDRARPVFEPIAESVIRVGEVGAGHAMKALNNLLSAIGLSAAAEIMEIGRRFGLEPHTMLEVLNRSTGANNATQTKFAQYVLSETYASGFRLSLMVKDMSTAVDLGANSGVRLPLSDACLDQWRAAAALLPNDADQTHFASLTYAGSGRHGLSEDRKETCE